MRNDKMEIKRDVFKRGAADIRRAAENGNLELFYRLRDYWRSEVDSCIKELSMEANSKSYWIRFRQFENDINHEIKQAEIDGRKCFGM